jgi:hypothetical protein
MTVVEWLHQFDPDAARQDIHGLLGQMLFSGEDGYKPTDALSGGETARVWVIIILSYLIGIGQLTHIVAGSAEVLYVAFTGASSLGTAVWGYMLPTLIGNIIGGVALVAVLGHVQFVVHNEDVAL